ncbi:30S ribosomal protein S2 [bacterium]|nr:30S ribosomal protein S2 [bacterium]
MSENKAPEVVTMRQLLECGVHFGHQTKRWNPKMKRYIFTSRNGIHVIDLQQTIKLIKKAYQVVREVVKNNGTILLVGTKKQAQDAIQSEAIRCGMPYVHHRWLGGTLTNNVTIRQSINKLKQYNRMSTDGTFEVLSNKEAAAKRKTLTRLSYYLDGIKDMHRLPSLVFIVDTKREMLAVKEANILKIPIIGVVDTNADPNEVQYPIPANDDAIRAIKLICSVISKAVLDGQAERSGVVVDEAIEENLVTETAAGTFVADDEGPEVAPIEPDFVAEAEPARS